MGLLLVSILLAGLIIRLVITPENNVDEYYVLGIDGCIYVLQAEIAEKSSLSYEIEYFGTQDECEQYRESLYIIGKYERPA